MKHERSYNELKRYGHSPVKALEIIVSASRGDSFSLKWIRLIYKLNKRKH